MSQVVSKKRTLFDRRIVVSLMLLQTAVLLSLAINTERYLRKAIIQSATAGTQIAANLLALQYTLPVLAGRLSLSEQHMNWIADDGYAVSLTVQDGNGNTSLFESHSTPVNEGRTIFRSIGGDLYPKKQIQASAPIVHEGEVIGNIILGLDPFGTFASIRIGRWQAVAISTGGLLLSFLLVWTATRSLLHPIRALVKAAAKAVNSELNANVQCRTIQEINELAGSLRAVAERQTVQEDQQVNLAPFTPRIGELAQLAGYVANEIRNPLAGISGCSQVLKKMSRTDFVRAELIDMIGSDVERLDHIVGKFLDFARYSDPECQTVMVSEVVETAISAVSVAILNGLGSLHPSSIQSRPIIHRPCVMACWQYIQPGG